MSIFYPHSNEWLLNKFHYYEKLRNLDSAYYSEKYNMYIMTRYEDVLFILNNPKIFSSAKGNLIIEKEDRFNVTLGASDDPIHNNFKQIVKNAYTKDNIKRVAKLFREKAITQFEGKTELDISETTEELSAWSTAEILNFPLYKPYIKNIVVDSQKNNSFSVLKEHIENYKEKNEKLMKDYIKLIDIARKKIPSTSPGVYREYINNSDGMNKESLLIGGPMISGTGSLIAALQFLTLDLYRENQLDILLNDRSLIPFAVNESLRFNTSTGRFSRTVTEDIIMHGVKLKPDDRVCVCLESANRDPNKFVEPDRFDISRDTSGHLAWGHGVHACIALSISKELLCVYLEILLEKIGKYRIMTKNEDLIYKMTGGGTADIITNIILNKH
jgi:cytochrome P450